MSLPYSYFTQIPAFLQQQLTAYGWSRENGLLARSKFVGMNNELRRKQMEKVGGRGS